MIRRSHIQIDIVFNVEYIEAEFAGDRDFFAIGTIQIVYRLDKSGAPICFVTYIINEEAYLIAAWYKQRWEIEVFFKFIKQHLNVNHLVSRNINGIKVMIYVTMILAILIIAYKKINRIKRFKIARLKFELEPETEIMCEVS
ncbi:MAG: transposase [Sphingobacteriales bacterium]|nr:transposase [Sphingobacteriales bacterium]